MIKKQATILLFAVALTLTSCNIGATPAPTVDVNAINTAAFNTAMAQISAGQTQTALAAPPATSLPTNTPLSLATFPSGANAALPTVSFNTTPVTGLTPLVLGSPAVPAGQAPTAALGDSCSNNVFEGDITIPDGTVLEAGTNFTKTWKIRNTGTCLWDEGFALVYIGGSKPDLDPYNVRFTKKWDSKEFIGPGEAVDISVDLTTPCGIGKYEGHWRMRNDKGYYFGTILSVYVEVRAKRKNCGK